MSPAKTPIDRAREAWGDKLPDWVEGLAHQCMATSQNQVAKRLERSASLVSNVLGNRYPGDMKAVEELYRGVFEAAVVECPAMGSIPLDQCRHWRGKSRKLNNTNSRNVMMFRACRRCPQNTGGSDER